MKKLLSILCILTVFTLFGCSDSQDKTQLYDTWQLKDFSSIVPKDVDVSHIGPMKDVFCRLTFLTPEQGKRPAGFFVYAALTYFSGDIVPENFYSSKDNKLKFVKHPEINLGPGGITKILNYNFVNLIDKTQSYRFEHGSLFLYDGEKYYEFVRAKQKFEE